VDLDVSPGEVVSLLGANGAGKTTLMRSLTGTVRSRGNVTFDGVALAGLSTRKVARLGVGLVPQGRGTFAELSVRDNLRVGALGLARGTREDAVDEWLQRFPRLAERSAVAAGLLSGGEQQALAIARTCIARPRLLLCDEPSLGLSPAMSREVFAMFAELNRELGIAMLIVEQNAQLAMTVADHAYVLEMGAIVWQGDPDQLAAEDTLVRAYLGKEQ
jgi:branched-chain amino acid transport system ATP-binding protein